MATECNQAAFAFQPLGRREVRARFDGGRITSDAGALLLRETERATGIIRQLAACFTDHRDPDLIEHTVYELLAQRIYALCLGYEDLNDHDQLRHDPLLAILVGKNDPLGQDRVRERDKGKALAGKSTLNRLELTPARADAGSRYKKITADRRAVQDLFVNVFLQSRKEGGKATRQQGNKATRQRGNEKIGNRQSPIGNSPTATCRCTSSAGTTCSAPSCGRATSTPRPGRCLPVRVRTQTGRSFSASWRRSA